MVQCEICRSEFKNLNGLSKHIKKIHDIYSEKYYLQYLGTKGICSYCGQTTKFKNLVVGYQKYCNSYCCNNDTEKRNLVSKLRKDWWENSPKVEETKKKIKNTVLEYWKDPNSVYYSKDFRQNLSTAHKDRWKLWRKNNLNELITKYGFKVVDFYEHAHSKALFKCLNCENIFESDWNSLQQGKQCPFCLKPNNVSLPEYEIVDFIKQLIPDKEILQNRRDIIPPFELDIFVPEFNLAFEYNGLYSHSANCHWGGKNKNYHLNKTKLCEKQNIQLIHIFEDEWLFKEEIVKSRISNFLNKNRTYTIYARKCLIREISIKEKNKFLKENHLQGEDTCQVKLGAYHNGELISVMTFSYSKISKGSFKENEVWELSRFCSKLNYNVIGIASKLLVYFKRNYKWKKIFTYADRRWSNGELYHKLGFTFNYFTSPNYWYLKNYRRIHRFSLRKTNNDPKDLTEFQIRSLQGYNWIWDCGNFKFSMINNGGQR